MPNNLFFWTKNIATKKVGDLPAIYPDDVCFLKYEPVIETNLYSLQNFYGSTTVTYNDSAIQVPNLISRFSVQHNTSAGLIWSLTFNYASGSPSSETITFQGDGQTRSLGQFVIYSLREISSIVLDNTTNNGTLRVFAAFGTAPLVRKAVV